MKRMRRRATALVLVLAMMLSCGINVFAAADRTRHNFEIEIEYTGDTGNDRVDLGDAIYDELYDLDFVVEYYEIGTDNDEYDLDNELLYYGRVNSSDVYIAEPADEDVDILNEDGSLDEEYIYYVAEDDYGDEYYGRIAIVLVKEGGGNTSTDEDLVYELDYEDALYLGQRMILDLEYLMDDDVDCIEFDIPSDAGDCGELYYYTGSDWEYLDESAVYYATATGSQMDLTEVYFESNDEGGEYFLYYKAYFANEDPLEGTVTINCGMTLVVEADIDSDEVYEFALIDFDNAVAEWDDDYVLNYITNVELDNSRDGELYDTSGKAVSFRTKYYAESAGDALIEEIIYEPANSASDVIINFTANVQRGNREAEEVSGVLKITIPDITVKAGVGDTVEIDWEVFQEYLEDTLNSTKYDVAYVTISGAPRSAEDGYLVTDGDELTTRGDKTFHMDPTGTQYDLEDLQYQAGSKKGSHKATFKVYYDASATSAPNYKATAEGTIRFRIIDSADSLPDGAKYTIDSVAVRSPLTNSLLDAIPHNDFYAEVAVTNVSSNSTDLLLLAVYAENGEMIDLSFLYANPQVGQTVTFGTLVDNDDGRAYRIKAFMWSSLVNPVPLAEAKAFPEELPDLSGDVVLGYKIIQGMLNGQLMNALMPDATAASMSVVSLDGVKWDQAAFAVPEFFLHRTNELGQSTLTSLKTAAEYRACGIYAGLVSKYTYKTGAITLDNGTELTEAEAGFTLYDSRFAANASALEMLDKNEPYIFYAPEGKAVYGVHADDGEAKALYKKLGGTEPAGEPWEGVIVANEYANLHGLTPLEKGQTRIQYTDESGKTQSLTFTNWSTDLTDIGEYRSGTAEDTLMLTVGGKAQNTVFQTGMEVSSITTAANVGDIKPDDNTRYFLNFEEVENGAFSTTGNGDWLRIVDNNDDGTADYVFKTIFEMTEVSAVAKDGTVSLENGVVSNELTLSEKLETGDIVLYTVVDGVAYVEKAESFAGMAEKYTYRTRVLTVNGKDYPQSDIEVSSIQDMYLSNLEDAKKSTEYTFYLDFFGNIRIYEKAPVEEEQLVLLTDAYYETNRNGKAAAVDAYLNGEIVDTDVSVSSSTDWKSFIETPANSNNSWDKLIEYFGDTYNGVAEPVGALTNLARYAMDEEGVMSLYNVIRYAVDDEGKTLWNVVESDYIDLHETPAEAGQTTYYGEYTYVTYQTEADGSYAEDADGNLIVENTATDCEVRVQANKDTVFYYVSYPNGIPTVQVVTGYKNSLDVFADRDIRAMYAVASNADTDAAGNGYWIADAIVIETRYPVTKEADNVVLAYSVGDKTVTSDVSVDAVDSDGALNILNVVEVDGVPAAEANMVVPAFYHNAENVDGDSALTAITADFTDKGIHAMTIERENALYGYFIATDGSTISSDETTLVYDLVENAGYSSLSTTDENDDTLVLTEGTSYVLYVRGGEVIYALLVNDTLTQTLYDAVAGVKPEPEPEPDPEPETQLVLLTDAYYETNRNGKAAAVDAYLNGEIVDTDVSVSSSTDWKSFIETPANSNNSWDKLIEYFGDTYNGVAEPVGALTNLARYAMDEEGVMSLYNVIRYAVDDEGKTLWNVVESDYIDLHETPAEAGQTTYYGEYTYVTYQTEADGSYAEDADGNLIVENTATDCEVRVQANKDTVFYYVSYPNGIPTVQVVTGYKNSLDVFADRDIRAMYAVADYTAKDADGQNYWVADAVVIETRYPAFLQGYEPVLAYNVADKIASGGVTLEVIGGDGALETLNVTNYNGFNTFKPADVDTPAFYFNSESAEGDSHIRMISEEYTEYGIYAVTVDRDNSTMDYITTMDGSVYYTDDATTVYDLQEKNLYTTVVSTDAYDEPLTLTKGEIYILLVDSDDTIIYALWVDSSDDPTADLYTKITGEELLPGNDDQLLAD